MLYSSQDLLTYTIKDCFKYRNYIVIAFSFLSLAILAVGVDWPKRYKAESLIYVDSRSSIQPLMQGAAVSTENKDIARNAKEIILGSRIINKVLESGGWLKEDVSPIDIEQMIDSIKKRTDIKKVGNSLIRIEFTDKDPNRAYLTTKNMAENYINIGKDNKIKESRSAYDFIERQAADYLEKLTSVDKKIKDFVTDNPDARPGTQEKVNQRISALQLKIEDTTLLLREIKIKRLSIQRQLSGEAAVTISQSREGKYRTKITDMESQLETLLLTYTETYPDVIRIKRQIEDVKLNLKGEIRTRDLEISRAKKEGKTYLDSSIATNPIYQQLRSGLSSAETEIATLETRKSELKALLNVEFDRMRRIEEGDSMMQALTRDYQVNQDIYQDLLKRRENARISRSLDAQQKGSTFTILEEAKLPLRPFGLRFLHFIFIALVVGIAAPVGVVLLLMQLDGKIRAPKHIIEDFGVPVLVEIPHLWKATEKQSLKNNYKLLGLLISIVLLIFVVLGSLKFMGEI